MRFIMNLPPAIKDNYTSLIEQLKQRYGKHIPPTTARQQLSDMKQGKDTPMQEFGEEVRNLITLAYPTSPIELQEELAAEAFLKGLRARNIAYDVINLKPKTLAEAQREVESHEYNYKAMYGAEGTKKEVIRRVTWEDGNVGTKPPTTTPSPATSEDTGSWRDNMEREMKWFPFEVG